MFPIVFGNESLVHDRWNNDQFFARGEVHGATFLYYLNTQKGILRDYLILDAISI